MFFFLISYHEINFKKVLNSVLKEMSQGHEIKPCLKQGDEMNDFCLKQGQALKASAAHHYPNFLECSRSEVSALLCLLLFGTLRPHISAVLRVTVYQENEKE